MSYKYQLIILGSQTSVKDELVTMLGEKIEDLGISRTMVKIIDHNNFGSDYMGNQPSFVYYIGDINGNFNHLDITQKLLKDGTMILPIYFTEDHFSKEIPKILENQNGILYKEIEKERIANITLEAFELLRNTRKIFISYKRNESTSIAIQLYEALEHHNFDTFLDTHSIPKAAPFQDELWHRMTDCDVILLLNTPGFLESHWCKEEFAEAGAKQIGIVQLVWPNHDVKKDTTSHLSYPKQLHEYNFIDGIYNNKDKSKLKPEFVAEIIKEVESVRARNLAARQDNLITDFRNIALKVGKQVTVQPEKFLTEDLPNGGRRIYIPTIGIPQSSSCQSAEIRKELLGYKDVSIRLIYDDLRIRDKWLKHLDWLNDNFRKDIKTLKKQEFESWLSQN
ncbi:toll/interleukin-1 receptor domain-containing protein [Pseudoflavitalea sp. X16]|uniref:toll/interleukin-1 receptor domain-containing protein n=1 Tax=Paraflavitalea devenefica TaxID=2716334 RepID=UPI00141FA0F1|nr:toll/interleukin-1 receptor domain-containing protein [Paraflavitalea devenefica]NII29401.1 toll/interleukin-1 receptor domain-containing protein [Paraflavitalea devenefica]